MKNHYVKIAFFAVFVLGIILIGAHGNDQPWDMQEDLEDTQQEESEDEKSAQEEMDSSVYGKLISVNVPGSTIVVEEESPYSDKVIGGDSPNIYTISVSTKTNFTSAASLNDLDIGDTVSVDYYTLGARRIAEHISLESRDGESSADSSDELLPALVSK